MLLRHALGILILVLAFGLTSTSAWAELAGEVRDSIEPCLAGQVPLPKDGYAHWGTTGANVLRDIILSPEHWLESRAQAIHALAEAFPSTETRTFLEKTLAIHDAAAAFLLRHILETLAAVYKNESTPTLRHALADPDLRVREVAATLLANVAPAQAKSALESRRRLEADPYIQRRLESLLKKIAD